MSAFTLKHLPYGVALSSASEFSMGPGLVSDHTRRATALDASSLAAQIQREQPGIVAQVAIETQDGWTVNGLPVAEWVRTFA